MNTTYKYLMVCGDIHGELDVIPNFIKKHELDNCAIIVAGDFGIGFESFKDEQRRIKYLSKRLAHTNSIVYAVRGNHDDPSYYLNEEFDTDNLKFVSDYTVLKLNDYNILCVGGAVSVDRSNRKPFIRGKGKGWWKDEIFVYDHDKASNLRNINIVVTHTSPDFCHPFTKGGIEHWLAQDIHLNSDVRFERASVTQLYYTLLENNDIKTWYYGHFHDSYKMNYKGLEFINLDINEIQEIR